MSKFQETVEAVREAMNIIHNPGWCAVRCSYLKTEGPRSYSADYPEDERGNCTKCGRRVWTRERWEEHIRERMTKGEV